VLEVSFRNLTRWKILETPQRLDLLRGIVSFQKNLAASGAFANPRSHIYYLPELYCAYFGRCYAAFMALSVDARPRSIRMARSNSFANGVLAYVRDELIAHEMNPFDAALALSRSGISAPRCRALQRHSIASCAISAKVVAMDRSRPMSGTR